MPEFVANWRRRTKEEFLDFKSYNCMSSHTGCSTVIAIMGQLICTIVGGLQTLNIIHHMFPVSIPEWSFNLHQQRTNQSWLNLFSGDVLACVQLDIGMSFSHLLCLPDSNAGPLHGPSSRHGAVWYNQWTAGLMFSLHVLFVHSFCETQVAQA